MMAGYSETLDLRYMTPPYPPRRASGACDVTHHSDVITHSSVSSHQLPLQCGAAMHHQQQQRRTVPRRASSYRSSGDDDDDDDDDEDDGEEGEDGGDRYPGALPSRDCLGGRGRYRGYAQRSEWVTLSKTILMQLVERICQLSFQGDMQPFGSSSAADFDLCADRHEYRDREPVREYRDREPVGWSLPSAPPQSLRPPPSNQQCTDTSPPSVAASTGSTSCDILAQTTPPPLCPPPQQPCINPLLPTLAVPPRASRRDRIVRPWSEDEDLPASVTQPPTPSLPLLSVMTSSHNITLPLTSAVTSQNNTLPVTTLQDAAALPSQNQVTGSHLTFASRTRALEINKDTPPSLSRTETMDDDDNEDVFKSSSVNISQQPCDVDKENVLDPVNKVSSGSTGEHTTQNVVSSYSLVTSFTTEVTSLPDHHHHRVVQNDKNTLIDLLSDSNTDRAVGAHDVTPDQRGGVMSRDVTRTINEASAEVSGGKTREGYGREDTKRDVGKHGGRKSKKFTNEDVSRYPDVVGYQVTTAGRGARKRRAQGGLGGDVGGEEGRLIGGVQLYLVNKRLCDENTTLRSEQRSSLDSELHSSRQSWVALNKSLVYGMIDSALAAQCDVKRKQQKHHHHHHQRVAHKERLMTSRSTRESAHDKRLTLNTLGMGRRTEDDVNNAQDIGSLRDTKVCDPDTLCVDVRYGMSTVSTEMDVTLSDVTSRKTQVSDPSGDVSSAPLATAQKKSNKTRSRIGKTFIESQDTEKLFGRNNNNNNNNNNKIGGYDSIDSRLKSDECDDKDNSSKSYVCRELVLQTNNSTGDIDVCTNDADHELENEPLLRGLRNPRGVQRTHKRAASVIALQGGIDVRRTLGGSNEGVSPTPRWIALDKSQVCSLVESLVSTMMMLDDPVQHLPAQSPVQSLAVIESQLEDNVGHMTKLTSNTCTSGVPPSIINFTGDAGKSPTLSCKSLEMISDVNVDEFQQLVPPSSLLDESPGSRVTSDVQGDPSDADEALVVLEGVNEKMSLGQSRRQAIKWKSSMLLRMRSEHVLKVTTATSSQSH